MEHILGIDLGTTTIKVVVIEPQNGRTYHAAQEYDNLYPMVGWVEQGPHTWFRIAKQLILQLAQAYPAAVQQVGAIGFSGQMHGTTCLGQDGQPLRPAILWADRRSQKQVDWIEEHIGGQTVARMTGSRAFPGFMLPTSLWIMQNEPDIWRETRYLLLPKDYLRYCFTGEMFSEPSDASSTCLLDIHQRTWHTELLGWTKIDAQKLPPLLDSTSFAGTLKPEVAAETGLPANIPVFCGASDQACQAVGNGVLDPGSLSSTIGTGGQLFAPLHEPVIDPAQRLHLFCHALPDRWHMLAATLSAGLALRWLRDNLLRGESYAELAAKAAVVEPGAEGLLFSPYLQGERTPHLDPSARAIFAGISLHHKQEHFVRALMEGVVFSMREGLDLLHSFGVQYPFVTASGGAARHDLWLELQADIYNAPVRRVQQPEPAAAGAAMLAGVGAGIFGDVAASIDQLVRYSPVIEPSPARARKYQELYQRYKALYPAWKSIENS